jgi:hypothetical protein
MRKSIQIMETRARFSFPRELAESTGGQSYRAIASTAAAYIAGQIDKVPSGDT